MEKARGGARLFNFRFLLTVPLAAGLQLLLDDQFRDAGHLLRRSAYDFTKKFYAEVLKLPVGK